MATLSLEDKREKFQKICNEKYGNLYDLSKSEIKGERDEFTVICSKHGEFKTTQRNIVRTNRFICEECNKEAFRNHFYETMKKHFGDKYDFSKFIITDNQFDEGIVICKKHGEFKITRHSLMQGHGCQQCAREKIGEVTAKRNVSTSKTYQEALDIIKEKIGEEAFNNFIFDESSYNGTTKPMKVFCKKHNEWFERTPNRLSQGRGCDKCSYEHKYGSLNTYNKSFEELAREVHKKEDGTPLYDYLGFDEKEGKYIMYCHELDENGNEHGMFKQTRGHHLNGQGCPICRYIKSGLAKRNSLEHLKEDIARLKSDKNYIYDWDSYQGYKKEFRVYCCEKDKDGNEHGWFNVTPNNFLTVANPTNCPKCGRENTANAKRVTPEEFVERSSNLHRNIDGTPKYIYHPEEYMGYYEPIRITCKEHGDFWMSPANHLQGQGCKICNESKLERIIRNLLLDNGIRFIPQANSRTFDWLGKLSLDFYLPDYNIAIECQGKQHFNLGGWNEPFEIIQERDERKRKLCEENGVKLLYFSNLGIEYPYQVFEDENLLLEEILKNRDNNDNLILNENNNN